MNKKFIRITFRRYNGFKNKPLRVMLCECDYCLRNWSIKL